MDRTSPLQASILIRVPGAGGSGRPGFRGGRAHSLDFANTREPEDRSLRSDPVRDEAMPEVKNPKLSSWDVAYALNMAIACLIAYWIMTHTLSRFVDESSDFLGGMWAVVATVFVFRETRHGSLSAGIARLIATSVSFALCLLYLSLFPFTPVGMAALIAIGTFVMALLGRREDIVTVGITTAVVMVVAAKSPVDAWQQPVLRLADTVVGIAVGVVCQWTGSYLFQSAIGAREAQ
ncbi:hypothetical protein BSZ19_35255 [Bradyrhizobium japonicum]|uniref:Integral membrane bound transporter domain-containing protein n=1 Tax=Bradyrhizobium japonicum TaxID=375 RepID=A0A1Y2JEA8_BRAJP|nr:hypothetical protein BSZ19_35255 [Bradyrhizobium japonicum]